MHMLASILTWIVLFGVCAVIAQIAGVVLDFICDRLY